MNGGNPGIQPWTNKYQNTIRVLRLMMQDPNSEFTISNKKSIYFDELVSLGVFELQIDDSVKLNIERLQQCSVVVDDEMYDNMRDINWLREQRKKLGLIEGKVKGEEFRARQQARRKNRRAHAKEQRAKREAQPPVELPLHDILFPD